MHRLRRINRVDGKVEGISSDFSRPQNKMKFAIVLVALFGIGCASASLKDDFHDILDVLPLAEIRGIARKYLNNDAEFQKVVAYLQGPEWAALVKAVADKPAYQSFKAYLIEAGIDVDAVIKFIHDLIAGAHPEGRAAFGVREFLDEVKAIIPVDELLLVLDDKLTNSADFKEFYAKISSDKGHALFDEVRAMDEVQRLAAKLREMGVDLDKALDVIYAFLGWE